MNDRNYDYLINQLKNTGFGDSLNDELRKNLEKQNADFTLSMQKTYGSDQVSATLHFKKSAESDMFFFNKYDLNLKKEGNDMTLHQSFYPDKNITLKEGYNLLDGRAVHKTLTNKQEEKYGAWLQLDFKNTTQNGNYEMRQYHQNYGFDLEKALSKYPIKELNNEKFKSDLMRSLERGNLQSATLSLNSGEQKIFITANPGFKSLSAFDESMQKIRLSEVLQVQKQEPANQENTQNIMQQQDSQKTPKLKNDSQFKESKDSTIQKKTRKQKVT